MLKKFGCTRKSWNDAPVLFRRISVDPQTSDWRRIAVAIVEVEYLKNGVYCFSAVIAILAKTQIIFAWIFIAHISFVYSALGGEREGEGEREEEGEMTKTFPS